VARLRVRPKRLPPRSLGALHPAAPTLGR
jgi:hypothetical protein